MPFSWGSNKKGTGFGFQIQDSRLWGEETSTLNDLSADGLDTHQAFALIPFGDSLQLKVGRQEIAWDNPRLVGNVGWTQRARAFDAARLTYSGDAIFVDAFYVKLGVHDSCGDGHTQVVTEDGSTAPYEKDVDFGGVQFGYDGIEGLHISVNALSLPVIHFACLPTENPETLATRPSSTTRWGALRLA